GGGGNATGRKFGNGEFSCSGNHTNQFVRRSMNLRGVVEFGLVQDSQSLDLANDLAHVLHGMDNVSGTGLTLGADHGCAFGDAAKGLAQIAGSAHERSGEGVLVDVVDLIGRMSVPRPAMLVAMVTMPRRP